jgi:hypothetical protein
MQQNLSTSLYMPKQLELLVKPDIVSLTMIKPSCSEISQLHVTANYMRHQSNLHGWDCTLTIEVLSIISIILKAIY